MRIIKKILKWFFLTLGFILVLLMILPYFFSIEERELPLDYKPFKNSEFFVSHDTRIHYQTWKPNTDSIKNYIVFIHGFSGSTFSFRNNIDTLVKTGNFVLAIDMPAFGYSDKSDTADYTDTSRVLIINELLSKINPNTKWTLIGHSMGASIVANYATKYPNKTENLIFIDGPAFDNSNEKQSFTSKIALFSPIQRWAEVIAKHKFINYDSFRELLSSAYGREPDSKAIVGYMLPFYYKRSAAAIFDMAANSGLAKIDKNKLAKTPMLLIWGDEDRWLPISLGESFVEQNPSIVFKRISKAGHCSMETHPNEVNTEIVNFLKK